VSPHWQEWLNLVVRWFHVIAGVAWIGASFYFNWLEGRLDRGSGKPDGIAGDLWAVHGGGFYHVQKYEVAPEALPEMLHWFKWEAYTTWLSGVVLLLIIYYLNPGLHLLGSNPYGLSATQATVTGLGTLIAGWALYHGLCSTSLVDRPFPFAVIGLALGTALAFGLTQVFDPRAAFIHVGATIGTIMAANVFFVIIPAQRLMVDAMSQGQAPDPAPGKDALRRSLHNNYLTLPVVFIMISHHFPATFGHPFNWAILALLAVGSAAVRHIFNLRNQGRSNALILPSAIIVLGLLIWWTQPQPLVQSGDQQPGGIRFWQVRQVVDAHCISCHSATPSDANFSIAPLGLMLDTPEQIQAAADKIYARAVATPTMPLGNASNMTETERVTLGAWIESGADLK
jgi:uncharacterized membrane protein